MEINSNMNDNRYRFYGCYQGNYEKNYRWQCKEFADHISATHHTQHATRDSTNITLLIPINNNIPKVCDKMIITNHIRKINKVDIN
jgi:hypothetical protein